MVTCMSVSVIIFPLMTLLIGDTDLQRNCRQIEVPIVGCAREREGEELGGGEGCGGGSGGSEGDVRV